MPSPAGLAAAEELGPTAESKLASSSSSVWGAKHWSPRATPAELPKAAPEAELKDPV
jgi:hypothetical protein